MGMKAHSIAGNKRFVGAKIDPELHAWLESLVNSGEKRSPIIETALRDYRLKLERKEKRKKNK